MFGVARHEYAISEPQGRDTSATKRIGSEPFGRPRLQGLDFGDGVVGLWFNRTDRLRTDPRRGHGHAPVRLAVSGGQRLEPGHRTVRGNSLYFRDVGVLRHCPDPGRAPEHWHGGLSDRTGASMDPPAARRL